MRVEVARNHFARLLQQVTRVVESRNTIPILDCVRLVTSDGRLSVTATDLDIEAAGSIECAGEASYCLNARLLASIVAKVVGDVVVIETQGAHTVVLRCGKSRYKLDVLAVAGFPVVDRGQFDAEFEIDFADAVSPVQFAISSEETRFYLNGIFLEGGDGALTLTATDGHRLSTRQVDGVGRFEPIIVPKKLIAILPKGKVSVAVSTRQIRVSNDDVSLTSRVIDGTFPDYRRVVPANNDKVATFESGEMRAAVERVTLIAGQKGRAVRLSISGGEIGLWSRGEGEATDCIECKFTSADGAELEPMDIGFNAQYVADALGAFPLGPVNLAVSDAGAPAIITSDRAEGLRIVLMPMRV